MGATNSVDTADRPQKVEAPLATGVDRQMTENRTGSESATLEAVRKILPFIAASAPEGEENRALLPEVVEGMAQAGIFRMMVPKEFRGDALTPMQVNAIIEELAMADAAAGWTAMVAVGFNILMSRFPRQTIEEVFADGPDVPMRGAIAPNGKAVRVEGGYRITGRWPFASGPFPPRWMFGGAVCHEDGAPVMGPKGPRTCLALVPVESAEFFDTWHTVGLRGTDSRDFAITDVFVPDHHIAEPLNFEIPSSYDEELFKLPFPMIAGPTHSAVCLGIVKAALSELADLSKTKKSAFNPLQTLAESQIFHFQLAELALRYAALDALHVRQLQGLAPMAANIAGFDPEFHISRGASWIGYIHQESTAIMNEIVELAGSASVYNKSRLQQRWRDARIAAQHNAGMRTPYPVYGARLSKA